MGCGSSIEVEKCNFDEKDKVCKHNPEDCVTKELNKSYSWLSKNKIILCNIFYKLFLKFFQNESNESR